MFVVTLIVGSFDANFESDVRESVSGTATETEAAAENVSLLFAIAIQEGRSLKAGTVRIGCLHAILPAM